MPGMKIETLAIYYHKPTDDRNCSNCVYHEIQMTRGIICNRWDEQTRRDMICGEHNPGAIKKPQEKKEIQENTLF